MSNKNNNQSISQAEAKVLYILWDESPLDGKQIAEKLKTTSWSFVTVKTLINRLLNKGFLSFEKKGRRYLYQSTISKKQYLKTENKQFLDRIYGGSLSGLFASFSENEKISQSELKEIKQMINKMEQES